MASYGFPEDDPRIQKGVIKRTYQNMLSLEEEAYSRNKKQYRGSSENQHQAMSFSPVQSISSAQGAQHQNGSYTACNKAEAIKTKANAFPQALHKMLQAAEQNGFQNIVSWQPHGRAFRIHDKLEFVKRILSVYFRMSKFTSFQRQINLYCFRRLTTGQDKGASYHELFRRDQPSLSLQMVRKRIKGNGTRAASDPESEPNFYSLKESELAGRSPDHHASDIRCGFQNFVEQKPQVRDKPVPVEEKKRISNSTSNSMRQTWRDSCAVFNNGPSFQPHLGMRLEPLHHCDVADERICNNGHQVFSSSKRIAALTSSPSDSKVSSRNGRNSGNLIGDFMLPVSVVPQNSLRSETNSFCDFQDEDIVSFCSKDWLIGK